MQSHKRSGRRHHLHGQVGPVKSRELILLAVFLVVGLLVGRSCVERVNTMGPIYEVPTR